MSAPRANLAGAGLMLAAVTCLTSLDAILKILAARHDPVFLAFCRNAAQVGYLLVLLPLIGPARMLCTRRPALHLARGVLLLATTVFIVEALKRLPMAQVYAITFSTPLLAAALAAVFLRERPTRRQTVLIAAGFAGVLIVVEPGRPQAGWALLLPIAMAASNALFHVITRAAGRDLDPFAMLFYVALVALLLSAPTLPFTASALRFDEVALLALGGLLGTAGHLCLVQAFRLAPTAIVSPMVYAQVIVAGALGFLLFGETPSSATVAGAVVVAVCGVLLVRSPPAHSVK